MPVLWYPLSYTHRKWSQAHGGFGERHAGNVSPTQRAQEQTHPLSRIPSGLAVCASGTFVTLRQEPGPLRAFPPKVPGRNLWSLGNSSTEWVIPLGAVLKWSQRGVALVGFINGISKANATLCWSHSEVFPSESWDFQESSITVTITVTVRGQSPALLLCWQNSQSGLGAIFFSIPESLG